MLFCKATFLVHKITDHIGLQQGLWKILSAKCFSLGGCLVNCLVTASSADCCDEGAEECQWQPHKVTCCDHLGLPGPLFLPPCFYHWLSSNCVPNLYCPSPQQWTPLPTPCFSLAVRCPERAQQGLAECCLPLSLPKLNTSSDLADQVHLTGSPGPVWEKDLGCC